MRIYRSLCILVTHILLAGLALPVSAADATGADKWAFNASVYLWGASIDAKPNGGETVHISFSDIIEDLDFALMTTLRARKGKWSLLADIIYLDIDGDDSGSASLIGRDVKTKIDIELEAWIVTAGAGYTVMKTDSYNVDLLAGARYLWLELPLEFDLGGLKEKTSPSGDNWNGIVGVKGEVQLSDNWYAPYYADVGAGDADLTWQAALGLNYRFKKADVAFGYRYLDFDIDGSKVDDITVKGPYAGVRFHF